MVLAFHFGTISNPCEMPNTLQMYSKVVKDLIFLVSQMYQMGKLRVMKTMQESMVLHVI